MANGSYNPTTQQERPNSNNNSMVYRGCVSKGFRVTGILHIVAGIICIVFGIAAIILKAFASYVAMPIWMGLLVFIVTGILGVINFRKPQKKSLVIAYLVMSTVSAALSFIMMVVFASLTPQEPFFYWDYCHPLYVTFCESSVWSRMLVNGLLILIFILEMACGITSASLACYKKCRCCRQCCEAYNDGPGESTVVYYAANMGGAQMMAVPNNQCAQPIYIAGGRSGAAVQPAQMMYLAPSPQPQTFVQLPVGTPQNQPIPRLTPGPPALQGQPVLQQQPGVVQQQGMVQQPSGFATAQGGLVQPQGPGQMQPQPVQDSKAPLTEPAGMAQQPGVVQQGVVQQPSGLATGQAGFVQVPGQMRHQIQGIQMQPQVLAAAPGQVSLVQVHAPRGQIQMIPTYPQVMLAPAPQQIPQPQSTPLPAPNQQSAPAQQQVQQTAAPSQAAQDQAEEGEPDEVTSGEISTGHFSDEAALI